MLKDKLVCFILSCDKFSDLWAGNVKLFNEHWPDRDFDTYLVTDKPAAAELPRVQIMAAGDAEWSERLSAALKNTDSEFVFITLDDYFLISPVASSRMAEMIALMDAQGFDYLRFYPRPKRALAGRLDGCPGMYHVDTSCDYSVNLYPSLWRRSFLESCIKEPQNAWSFEVSLSKAARAYGAKCICSCNDDYRILDVVRKGKILHKAMRYFKAHPGIYSGNRPVQSRAYELSLWFKTMLGRHTSGPVHVFLKKVYKRFGGVSYIDSNNN